MGHDYVLRSRDFAGSLKTIYQVKQPSLERTTFFNCYDILQVLTPLLLRGTSDGILVVVVGVLVVTNVPREGN